MTCEDCFFYAFLHKDAYDNDINIGICRYDPPVYIKDLNNCYPRIKSNSWCGKFKKVSIV
jgi:hypothetical protein